MYWGWLVVYWFGLGVVCLWFLFVDDIHCSSWVGLWLYLVYCVVCISFLVVCLLIVLYEISLFSCMSYMVLYIYL